MSDERACEDTAEFDFKAEISNQRACNDIADVYFNVEIHNQIGTSAKRLPRLRFKINTYYSHYCYYYYRFYYFLLL